MRAPSAWERDPAGGPRAARWPWVLPATLLIAMLATVPMPVRAASVLSDGAASPASGTTATSFDFSVVYTSSHPARNALSVSAQVGAVTVPLSRTSGKSHNGTWTGSSTLPVGIGPVTFHATVAAEQQPEPLVGPIVTVIQAPTPPPSPTPRPTPEPTPRPTDAPTATAQPSLPTRATPPPAQPAPLPTQQSDTDEDATATPGASSSASPRASVLAGTPGSDPTRTSEVEEAPVESPEPSASSADQADRPRGSLLAPLLFVGGTMSLVGAAVLGRQWYVTRRP
jgi:hypothetical protein